MVAATTAELARLGVPFFNNRHDLLVRTPPSSIGSRNPRHEYADDERKRSDTLKLDESQLRELQAKMLVLLEDLCSE